MARARLLLPSLLAACAAPPAAGGATMPDWSGPPLQVTSRTDGGLELVLLAPTAGHTFALHAVTIADGCADVDLRHATPGDVLVAQVVTPLPLVVPAAQLAGCRRIRLWVATQHGADDRREPARALAFVLDRS
ncbi:MAG: hypothetical protein KF830_15475 [Planctomycetes bacterium]|nr:hypothetical protein [Planctomycetota bacterium]